MLDELTSWGHTCGLKFNAEKTIAVHFSRKRKTSPYKLKLEGQEINYSNSAKYLGVVLDRKLSWREHIEQKITGARKLLGLTSRLVSDNYGPKPPLMKWCYEGIVRTALTYGALVWGQKAEHYKDKLRKLNRLAINTLTRVPKSAPTRALEIMTDIKPLHLFIQEAGLAAYIRLNKHLRHTWDGRYKRGKSIITGHLKHWEEMTEVLDFGVNDSDKQVTSRQEFKYNVNLESLKGGEKFLKTSQYNVYTDGSKIDGQVGAGLIIIQKDKPAIQRYIRLPDHCSVFQAEIYAIGLAAQAIIENSTLHNTYVKIFTDNQASMKALNKKLIRNRSVFNTYNLLNEAYKLVKTLSLTWIKAHVGTKGNETADELAKRGANLPEISVDNFPVPSTSLKTAIKDTYKIKWETEWAEYKEARQSHYFYSKPDSGISKQILMHGRHRVGTFIRIISGHNGLNYFRNKVDPESYDPYCRFCKENQFETFIHFISSCPRFANFARETFLNLLPDHTQDWNPDLLLSFADHPDIRGALTEQLDEPNLTDND